MIVAYFVLVVTAAICLLILTCVFSVYALTKAAEDSDAEALADELNDLCDLYEEREGDFPSDEEMETLDALRNGTVTLVPKA